MPFLPGQTGNPNGRPPGSRNKANSEIKAVFQDILNENIQTLREDIAGLTSEKRVQALLKIAEFLLPKPQNLDIQLEYRELERLLQSTPEKYVEQLTAKVLELHTKNKEEQ